MRIREDAQVGMYVENLKEEVVLSAAHALSLIAAGEGGGPTLSPSPSPVCPAMSAQPARWHVDARWQLPLLPLLLWCGWITWWEEVPAVSFSGWGGCQSIATWAAQI